MLTKRLNTFETNSSSTHVITIKNNEYWSNVTELIMEGGDYNWEWRKYDDAQSRLSYIFSAAIDIFTLEELQEYIDAIVTYFEEKGVEINTEWVDGLYLKEIDETTKWIAHKYDSYFGIDHQSGPKEDEDCMELAKSFADPEKVWQFVMDDSNYIKTGNDNDEPPDDWYSD